MAGISFQKLPSFLKKRSGLLDHSGDFFLADNHLKAVVGLKSSVKSIQQEAVKFRIDQSSLGEAFPEERVYAAVLARAQTFLIEQRFGGIKHRVVDPSRSKIHIAVLKQRRRRLNCALGLFQQLAGVCVQTGIASSRTLARNGPSPFCHSRSDAKTRLTLVPYFRETPEISSLVRSISAP